MCYFVLTQNLLLWGNGVGTKGRHQRSIQKKHRTISENNSTCRNLQIVWTTGSGFGPIRFPEKPKRFRFSPKFWSRWLCPKVRPRVRIPLRTNKFWLRSRDWRLRYKQVALEILIGRHQSFFTFVYFLLRTIRDEDDQPMSATGWSLRVWPILSLY